MKQYRKPKILVNNWANYDWDGDKNVDQVLFCLQDKARQMVVMTIQYGLMDEFSFFSITSRFNENSWTMDYIIKFKWCL